MSLEKARLIEDKQKLQRSGKLNPIKRWLHKLADENSDWHKTIKGIENGVDIAQDAAKFYNDIAQWAGLPQVPQPFLKK